MDQTPKTNSSSHTGARQKDPDSETIDSKSENAQKCGETSNSQNAFLGIPPDIWEYALIYRPTEEYIARETSDRNGGKVGHAGISSDLSETQTDYSDHHASRGQIKSNSGQINGQIGDEHDAVEAEELRVDRAVRR
jgi:hypothetical protein